MCELKSGKGWIERSEKARGGGCWRGQIMIQLRSLVRKREVGGWRRSSRFNDVATLMDAVRYGTGYGRGLKTFLNCLE